MRPQIEERMAGNQGEVSLMIEAKEEKVESKAAVEKKPETKTPEKNRQYVNEYNDTEELPKEIKIHLPSWYTENNLPKERYFKDVARVQAVFLKG